MYRFIETIRIDNGEICNLTFHNRRLNETRSHFWQGSPRLQLEDYVKPVKEAGIFKARVVYGETGIEEVSYATYTLRCIQSLAIIPSDTIDYTYKSANREELNHLFAQRGACDDILIVKQGLVTDTSIANIALYDNNYWYTPKHPLLKGSKRAQLLEENVLSEKEIGLEDLSAFSTIRLFNAMIGWGELELPMSALHYSF
ncbi:aminotransferase class IV family protein [Bacteroides sp.]|uniref:aminotransferase class IV family protein n=1 Tax=Bacteroides sp. TaxID=29523 RepID=UPI002631BCA6|nr:aminotransferase class IV family protein [Bacteroides sp.]